jgi:hypothetical protein
MALVGVVDTSSTGTDLKRQWSRSGDVFDLDR